MFAYCGNNPVNRSDASGRLWEWIVIAVVALLLTGCDSSDEQSGPRKDLANAPDLDIRTATSETYNCYGNVICKQIVADPTGYSRGDTVEDTFIAVQNDLGGESNCKILASIDSPVDDGWYKVAMMCCPTDYHFIRLDKNGWYNKSGSDPSVGGCYIEEALVNFNTWYAIGVVGGRVYVFKRPGDPIYYNENGPLYFAVRSDWDKGGNG